MTLRSSLAVSARCSSTAGEHRYQLPGDELSEHVQYDNGSDEAFLYWLWHHLYGDEPFQASLQTRLRALPEPFAERLSGTARWDIYQAVRAGEWVKALDLLLTGLAASDAPLSPAERATLSTLLEAARDPQAAAAATPRRYQAPGPRASTGPGAHVHWNGRSTSTAADELHTTATARSAVYGHPGFVPDDLVARVTTDLRYSAADGDGLAGELCAALIWETADGGYRVLDAQAVQACAERASELRAQAGNPARPERPPAQSGSGEPGNPAGHEHVTGENGTGPQPQDQIRLDRSPTFDDKDRVLSPAAYQLHLRGTTDAARSERPGFITDAYLTATRAGDHSCRH